MKLCTCMPTKIPSVKCWYQDYPLGINIITPIVKDVCKSVGVVDENYKNQSLRATTATRMYAASQDEQMIQEVTGQTSICVCHYERSLMHSKEKPVV